MFLVVIGSVRAGYSGLTGTPVATIAPPRVKWVRRLDQELDRLCGCRCSTWNIWRANGVAWLCLLRLEIQAMEVWTGRGVQAAASVTKR